MPGREEEAKGQAQPDYGDAIDQTTFEQILEMDEDDEDGGREFSSSIVFGFFEQAQETFEKMDSGLESRDMKALSNLGHFLKGSSATLGLTKVQKGCEKIQHYGAHQNDEGNPSDDDDDKQLEKITKTLEQVREDYEDAAIRLRAFYEA